MSNTEKALSEFTVGKYHIDMGRSQITIKDEPLTMEPKALQVLLVLAENQGKVVSHQTIALRVWPNVQVAPNVLQRCIGQLRKAFGDDAKSPSVIATHPRIGYSLVEKVDWHVSSVNSVQESTATPTTSPPSKNIPLWIAAFSALTVTLLWVLFYPNPLELPLNKIGSLTTSDREEFAPVFSPDGRYVAFSRYIEGCDNELWAIDLSDNSHYLLTKTPGIYGRPSWSPDSNQLAFSSKTKCGDQYQLSACKNIQAISFALAKTTPQPTHQLLACNQQDFDNVVWLNDKKLAFSAKEDNRHQIMTLSLGSSTAKTLYTFDGKTPYSLAYKDNQLAIMQHDLLRKTSLMLLNPDGKTSRQVSLNVPKGFQDNLWWYASWHPSENALISAAMGSVFVINTSGDMTEYPLPTLKNIDNPMLRPDESNIVATMGESDSDIGRLDWRTSTQTEILHRSTVNEQSAQYQPGGELIAFLSSRSGSNQIWLSGPQPRQLSQLLENKSPVDDFIWSSDGKSIVYLANHQLQLLNLNGKTTSLDTPFKILKLYQQLDNQQLLLSVVDGKKAKLLIFNINTGVQQTLYNGYTRWAQLSDNHGLFMADEDMQLNHVTKGIKQPIEQLRSIKTWAQFYYQQNQLLIFDEDNTLWVYNLAQKRIKPLLKIDKSIKHIDSIDLKRQRLLFTKIVSSKREVVMFRR